LILVRNPNRLYYFTSYLGLPVRDILTISPQVRIRYPSDHKVSKIRKGIYHLDDKEIDTNSEIIDDAIFQFPKKEPSKLHKTR